ncbi:chondroitin AC/alginate lyase [Mucidula mucida]|nr:chondroitin AC/alginate lyase [Mucidula mucida]
MLFRFLPVLGLFALCTSASTAQIDERDVIPRAPSTFTHPGVLIDRAQLDFIKGKVNAGEEPWSSAYSSMLSHSLASLSRTPTPTTTVECGPTSTPNIGCTDERQEHSRRMRCRLRGISLGAISYMNAWAKTIKGHTNSNAPLQTGWAGASWARAAEIIRHTYTGWAAADVTAFETMLRNVYLPTVIKGSQSNGNWELVMLEAALGIAVFLEDKTSYDTAMTKYMGRVPAYVYLLKDGSLPKVAPGSGLDTSAKIITYWQNQPTFQANGLAQETCRDFVHTGYGIASIGHIAETSRIQGTDLYTGDIGERLRYALGFHAAYETGASAKPSWLCPGKDLKLGLGPIPEVGYNAMHNRLGYAMTNTEKMTLGGRPASTNYLFLGWETLTHGDNPA